MNNAHSSQLDRMGLLAVLLPTLAVGTLGLNGAPILGPVFGIIGALGLLATCMMSVVIAIRSWRANPIRRNLALCGLILGLTFAGVAFYRGAAAIKKAEHFRIHYGVRDASQNPEEVELLEVLLPTDADIEIKVDANGSLYIDEQRFPAKEFVYHLRKIFRDDPEATYSIWMVGFGPDTAIDLDPLPLFRSWTKVTRLVEEAKKTKDFQVPPSDEFNAPNKTLVARADRGSCSLRSGELDSALPQL